MSLLPAALHLAAPLLPSALSLLRQLGHAALMGTLFVLAVWLLCRLAPRLPAGLRCALWWLASLKLLLGLAWPAPRPDGRPHPPSSRAHARDSPRRVRTAGRDAQECQRLPDCAGAGILEHGDHEVM